MWVRRWFASTLMAVRVGILTVVIIIGVAMRVCSFDQLRYNITEKGLRGMNETEIKNQIRKSATEEGLGNLSDAEVDFFFKKLTFELLSEIPKLRKQLEEMQRKIDYFWKVIVHTEDSSGDLRVISVIRGLKEQYLKMVLTQSPLEANPNEFP